MSDLHAEITKKLTTWLIQIREANEEDAQEVDKNTLEYCRIEAKTEAIDELIIDLNDPIVFVDVPLEMQQSLNVITANKIIKDEL